MENNTVSGAAELSGARERNINQIKLPNVQLLIFKFLISYVIGRILV